MRLQIDVSVPLPSLTRPATGPAGGSEQDADAFLIAVLGEELREGEAEAGSKVTAEGPARSDPCPPMVGCVAESRRAVPSSPLGLAVPAAEEDRSERVEVTQYFQDFGMGESAGVTVRLDPALMEGVLREGLDVAEVPVAEPPSNAALRIPQSKDVAPEIPPAETAQPIPRAYSPTRPEEEWMQRIAPRPLRQREGPEGGMVQPASSLERRAVALPPMEESLRESVRPEMPDVPGFGLPTQSPDRRSIDAPAAVTADLIELPLRKPTNWQQAIDSAPQEAESTKPNQRLAPPSDVSRWQPLAPPMPGGEAFAAASLPQRAGMELSPDSPLLTSAPAPQSFFPQDLAMVPRSVVIHRHHPVQDIVHMGKNVQQTSPVFTPLLPPAAGPVQLLHPPERAVQPHQPDLPEPVVLQLRPVLEQTVQMTVPEGAGPGPKSVPFRVEDAPALPKTAIVNETERVTRLPEQPIILWAEGGSQTRGTPAMRAIGRDSLVWPPESEGVADRPMASSDSGDVQDRRTNQMSFRPEHPQLPDQSKIAPEPQETLSDAAELGMPDTKPAQAGGVTALPPTTPRMEPAPTPWVQLSRSITEGLASPAGRATELHLSPDELGKVSFEISTGNDGLQIRIFAERPETLDLLRRQGEHLLHELRQSGLSNGSVSYGDWGQRGTPSDSRRPGRYTPGEMTESAETEISAFRFQPLSSGLGRLHIRL